MNPNLDAFAFAALAATFALDPEDFADGPALDPDRPERAAFAVADRIEAADGIGEPSALAVAYPSGEPDSASGAGGFALALGFLGVDPARAKIVALRLGPIPGRTYRPGRVPRVGFAVYIFPEDATGGPADGPIGYAATALRALAGDGYEVSASALD